MIDHDKDPKMHNDAKLISSISHDEVLNKRLAVMDLAAIAIAAENNMPIGIVSIDEFADFVNKKGSGSIIGKDWR